MACTALTTRGPAGALALTACGSDGLPVLLVPGGGGARGHWAGEQARLGAHRSVALDLRGLGDSAPDPRGRNGLDDLAQDALAAADALGLARFVVVGHSLGAAVALALGAREPARVAGLVLVDPSPDNRDLSPGERAELEAGLAPQHVRRFADAWYDALLAGAPHATWRAVKDALHAADPAAFAAQVRALLGFDPLGALARYPGPRLALLSERFLSLRSLHLHAPWLPAEVVPGTSHWVHLDAPEAFHAALVRFVRQVEAAEAPRAQA